jgi:hypothetical protein
MLIDRDQSPYCTWVGFRYAFIPSAIYLGLEHRPLFASIARLAASPAPWTAEKIAGRPGRRSSDLPDQFRHGRTGQATALRSLARMRPARGHRERTAGGAVWDRESGVPGHKHLLGDPLKQVPRFDRNRFASGDADRPLARGPAPILSAACSALHGHSGATRRASGPRTGVPVFFCNKRPARLPLSWREEISLFNDRRQESRLP